jgi:hypothetical protein
MAHNYLLELHDLIEERISLACESSCGSIDLHDECAEDNGRIEALVLLREFLRLNYNDKLPRRIFRKLQGKTPARDFKP